MIRLQEAENQIIVDYEVYARRPNDSDLLIPAIAAHQVKLGRVPRLVAADAGFYFARNEAAASAFPIARPRVPNANESRGSAGSAMARNGAPDARDASASSHDDMDSVASGTRPMMECSAGSGSA
jgi:hypothetical protein